MIASAGAQFASYYQGVRKRTRRLVSIIPEDRFEWTPVPGKFTFGDVLRHLASLERYMWAETVQGKPSSYPGHGLELANGHRQTIDYFDRTHHESIAIFSGLDHDQLQQKCLTPAGYPITVSKWLRAMVEHEAHHRGQLYVYLAHLGVAAPPMFGLTSEEVKARSA